MYVIYCFCVPLRQDAGRILVALTEMFLSLNDPLIADRPSVVICVSADVSCLNSPMSVSCYILVVLRDSLSIMSSILCTRVELSTVELPGCTLRCLSVPSEDTWK